MLLHLLHSEASWCIYHILKLIKNVFICLFNSTLTPRKVRTENLVLLQFWLFLGLLDRVLDVFREVLLEVVWVSWRLLLVLQFVHRDGVVEVALETYARLPILEALETRNFWLFTGRSCSRKVWLLLQMNPWVDTHPYLPVVRLSEVIERSIGHMACIEGNVPFGVSYLVHALFICVMTLQLFLKRWLLAQCVLLWCQKWPLLLLRWRTSDMRLLIEQSLWTHRAVGIHQLMRSLSILATASLQFRKHFSCSLFLLLRTLTESRPSSKGTGLHPMWLIALLRLVKLVYLMLSEAVFRVIVVVWLLPLVSHPTIVTAVIILLLIITIHSRDHLLHDILLTLRPTLELVVRLVIHHQLGTTVGRLGTSTLIVLHDGQIVFYCLWRVLEIYKVFEKPLVVFRLVTDTPKLFGVISFA